VQLNTVLTHQNEGQKSETLKNNRKPYLPFLKKHKQHPIKFKTQTSLTVSVSTYIKLEQSNKKLCWQRQTQTRS